VRLGHRTEIQIIPCGKLGEVPVTTSPVPSFPDKLPGNEKKTVTVYTHTMQEGMAARIPIDGASQSRL